MIKKIAIIGPESTGKTTLCHQLARHFKTSYVPEFAREHLDKHGSGYSYEDLYTIALGQINAEEDQIQTILSNSSQLLFIDTDLNVIKIWSEFVFNKCDNRILTAIANAEYDLYFLCDIDQPWSYDHLRENADPETRDKIFHYYKETLCSQHIPWVSISGDYPLRLETAIRAIEQLF